jgi:uncharacterized RmlC-like cupin family protein
MSKLEPTGSPLLELREFEFAGSGGMSRQLSFVEFGSREIPFDVKRAYWLHNLNPGDQRGRHGHKQLEQVMICVAGCVNVEFHDGINSKQFTLNKPTIGLYVPAGLWRDVIVPLSNTGESALVVLSSQHYLESDYIRNFDHYREWAVRKLWGRIA